MKQIIKLTVIAITLIALTSFSKSIFAPKLYPEIELYFKNLSPASISNQNKSGLAVLKDNLDFSRIDTRDYNVIFTSDDEKSLAAQIILHTLAATKKLKRVNVFSCHTSTTISPQLVETLKKVGYKIQSKDNNTFEIRFADNADPISLKNVNCTDKSIPAENRSVITLCNDCNTSEMSSSAFKLSYKGNDLNTQIRDIATDLYHSIPKK